MNPHERNSALRIALFAMCLPVGLSACKKTEEAKSNIPAPPPTPSVERTAERHHLAPEGTFFLMERVSVPTQYGVTGIAPGTRVRLVQENGDKFRVTDGNTTFDVSADKITDDVDLGNLVARNDTASQRLLAAYIQQQNAADRRAHDAYIAMLDEQTREVERTRAAAAAAAPHASGKLDRGAYNRDPWPWIYRRRESFQSYHPHRY